jgi:hypothetical protein
VKFASGRRWWIGGRNKNKYPPIDPFRIEFHLQPPLDLLSVSKRKTYGRDMSDLCCNLKVAERTLMKFRMIVLPLNDTQSFKFPTVLADARCEVWGDKSQSSHRDNVKLKTTKEVVPVHAMKAYKGRRGMAPLILNLGARRRRVVNITLRPLYPL